MSYRLLDALGDTPATAADIADMTGFSRDSVRAQLSQLRSMGIVREVGRVPVEGIHSRSRSGFVTRRTALYAVAAA